jgi:hypothetical protein
MGTMGRTHGVKANNKPKNQNAPSTAHHWPDRTKLAKRSCSAPAELLLAASGAAIDGAGLVSTVSSRI